MICVDPPSWDGQEGTAGQRALPRRHRAGVGRPAAGPAATATTPGRPTATRPRGSRRPDRGRAADASLRPAAGAAGYHRPGALRGRERSTPRRRGRGRLVQRRRLRALARRGRTARAHLPAARRLRRRRHGRRSTPPRRRSTSPTRSAGSTRSRSRPAPSGPGWPVRVFGDYRRELVWGALALVDGSVYVPTAAYCDSSEPRRRLPRRRREPARSPLDGGAGRPRRRRRAVGLGRRRVRPERRRALRGHLGCVPGGSNTGDGFTETAGYGDRLVQLGEDLSVEDSSHPADLPDRQDLDFVGSPVALDRTGCGGLVVAADKDDVVYAWHRGKLGRRPGLGAAARDVRPEQPAALAARLARVARVAVRGHGQRARPDPDRRRLLAARRVAASRSARAPRTARRRSRATRSGSPSTATNVLDGYDARTGERVAEVPLGGTTLEAPTIVDHRLVVGTFTGLVEGFSLGKANAPGDGPKPGAAAAESSWVDARHGWQSRASGRLRDRRRRQVVAPDLRRAGRSTVARLSRTRRDRRRPRPGPLHVHDAQALDRPTAAGRGARRRRSATSSWAAPASSTGGSGARCTCSPRSRSRAGGRVLEAGGVALRRRDRRRGRDPGRDRRARLEPRPRPGLGHGPARGRRCTARPRRRSTLPATRAAARDADRRRAGRSSR